MADMLKKAERPLIWVGGTMKADAETSKKLEQLAEKWQLPMSPTQRRPHLFDFTHPNFGGYMGIRPPKEYSDMMKKSDLLVALGERLTDTTSQAYTFPNAPQPQLPLVHVWPDASEIGRVWRPDVGIACDPAAMVSALLEMEAPKHSNARQEWIGALNTLYTKFMKHEWEPTPDGVNFAAIVCGVDKYIAHDAAITSDAGNFGSFLHRYLTFRSTHTFLSSILGAMGSGVPMGVAAAMRDPNRQVVIFVGDGGILMTGNELATARLNNVNPIIILSDNDNYSTINMHHYVRYPGHVDERATVLKNPDFVKWAESFGAKAFLIKEEADIDPVFKEAFAVKGQPVLVHVRSSSIQMSAWRRKAA
jgi:acetolactate synthase-1/2/3 large subunit